MQAETNQPLKPRGVLAAQFAFLFLVCSPIDVASASAQMVYSLLLALYCLGLIGFAWWPRQRSWRLLTSVFAAGGFIVSVLQLSSIRPSYRYMDLISPVLGLLYFVSEAALAQQRRASHQESGESMDRGSLALIWRVNLCAVASAVTVSILRIGPKFPVGVPWSLGGAGVWIAGATLRWWAIRHLGRFFTVDVAVAADHRVVDDGPYQLVRHPSYTGLLLESAGLGLTLDNVLAFALLLMPILLVLLHRIRIEEQALRSALGEAYVAYCQRTRRLVPWVY